MRSIWTIFRREYTTFFTGPIGYIYTIAFLLVTNLLALFLITGFFDFPIADMRTYFQIMGGVTAIFVAAVTMRVWAEEMKDNTFEMLLTFPMRSCELVLGKFLACLAFFLTAILGTLTVPIMMIVVSRPDATALGTLGWSGLLDPGPVFGGYLGAILMGATMIALGMFISALCRDQIVAFVLTAPIAFGAYAIGVEPVKQALDRALEPIQRNLLTSSLIRTVIGEEEGLGFFLADFFGLYRHYANLVEGVLDGVDIGFFLVWILVFLVLNGFAIERRGRQGSTLLFTVMTVVLIFVGFAANALLFLHHSFGRIDLTQDRIHTLSPVSGEILSGLKDIKIKYWVSRKDKMPNRYRNLERDVRYKIDLLREASKHALRVSVRNDLDVAKELLGEDIKKEQRLPDALMPFQVLDDDRLTTKILFSAIEITYRDKPSEWIPLVRPEDLPRLEYLIVNKIYRLTREKPPVVAMVAPMNRIQLDPQMEMLLRSMGRPIPQTEDPYETLQGVLDAEKYEVRRIKLTKDDPLPESYDTLVVVEPKNLSERQAYEIARAISSGKPTFLAIQRYEWEYRSHRGGRSATRTDLKPGLDEVLKAYGLGIDDKVLMDHINKVPLTVGIEGQLGLTQPWDLPMQVLIRSESMNHDHPIPRMVEAIFYAWGTALTIEEKTVKKAGLTLTTLFQSGKNSWTRATGTSLLPEDIRPPADPASMRPRPLCILAEGTFPFAFAGKKRPEWPKATSPYGAPPPDEPETTPDPGDPTLQPGKLILVGSSMPFRKEFLDGGAARFFLNCIDYLTLGKRGLDIMALRDKTATQRTIERLSEERASFWKMVHLLYLYLVIAAAGVVMLLYRRGRRDRYLRSIAA